MKEKPSILTAAEAIINQKENAEKKAKRLINAVEKKVETRTLRGIAQEQRADIAQEVPKLSMETVEKIREGNYDLSPTEIAEFAVVESSETEERFNKIFDKITKTEDISKIKEIGTEIAMVIKENPEYKEIMIARTARALVESSKGNSSSEKTEAIKEIFDSLTGEDEF